MPTIIIGIVLLFFVLWIFIVCPRVFRKPDRAPFMGWWYAHRGFHDNKSNAPENSLPAFRLAVENGYGVELDVQLTKDEKVVVFHDNDLKRVCNVDAPVNSFTYEELQELTLFNTEERIPLFTEVLEILDGKIPMICEIKMVDNRTRVCELANDILKDYKGLYCVESFNPIAVNWFRKNRPELLRGQLSCNFIKEGDKKEPIGAWGVHWLLSNVVTRPDFIAYSCLSADNFSFILCKLLGALPVTWTIKTPELLRKSKNKFKLFIFEGFRPEEVDLK